MKRSPTEYKIKKHLSQREVEPDKRIWDNIQKALDENHKPNNAKLWFRYAGIAAMLCIGFLAYQIFTPFNAPSTNLVLDSKPVLTNPITFNSVKMNYLANPENIQIEFKNKLTQNPINTDKPIQKLKTETETAKASIDDETESLLQLANLELEKAEQERQLTQEVNALLAQAIENTQDEDQKEILQTLEASVLLAEVESEIQLEKPQNLKDKIWEALVSNLNDIKRSVVSN